MTQPNRCQPTRALGEAALVAALGWPGVAAGADPSNEPPEQATLHRAAMVVTTFDHFADACRQSGRFSAPQRREIDTWNDRQQVAQIREAMVDLRRRTPEQAQHIDQAARLVIGQIASHDIGPCEAAVRITRTADAQFASASPSPLAETPLAAAAHPGSSARGHQAAAERSRPSPQGVAQVERFGFESRAAMGVGGFITMKTVPIVLFRDGSVAKDVEALTHPGGPQAHRAANPDDWTHWRRAGGRLEIATHKGWEVLSMKPYDKVPDGLTLRGLFRRLGGTGNLAVGGTDSVSVTQEYRFSADGRVQRGGSAGSTAEAGNTSVVTQQVAPNRRGRYRVEGLMLLIDYDDGSREQRLLVTDPQDPGRALWLDGQDYVRRGD